MSKTMKSSMIEQPRNRNPNTTKTMKLNGPASVPAPTSVVMGPDREIISKNTSSTISTSSEQVDPMTGKSPDVKQLSHSVDFEAPTIKEHGRDGEHPFEPEVQGDQDRGYPLLRTVSEHLPVEYLYLSMNDKKKLSHSADSTSLNCRDSQSATLCPTQVSKWGAGGRGCGSGRGHECTPVAQYEIAFENIFSVKIQDFKLEESSRLKAKDKDVSSQDHPLQDESDEHGQDGGQPLKPEEHGQDGGPPLKPEEHDLDGRDPLKTKTSMDEFKRSTSSDSTAQDHGGGPPRELEEPSLDGQSDSRLNDTYTAYDWSGDNKISTYEAYAVAYDKISTYTAHEESYDDKATPCA